ncbi:MAG: hypothetical protein M3N98_05770 [Actinomycetota bacterium]|nr:hypothetical protein [Actinomycetota bacterium]
MSTSDERHRFLDYLMRSALTAPGARVSPAAGRVLAKLLVVVAIEGGNDLIMPYLVPVPGARASFEVRAYRAGTVDPTDVRPSSDAVAALRIAIRLAREGGDVGVEVLSRAPSGLERCVFVRDSTGEFEFRHATVENLFGDAQARMEAEQQWEATLAAWRAWVSAERPIMLASDWSAEGSIPLTPFDQPTASFDVLRFTDDPPQAALSAPERDDDQPPQPQPQPQSEPEWTDSAAEPPPSRYESLMGQPPDTYALIQAIQRGFADLVVEVDFSQVDRLIRSALDTQRRDLAEGLARRMSALLGDALALPDADELAASIAPLVSRPGDVADLVTARVGALLSETVLRRPVEGADASVPPGMMAAVERLQSQLDDVRDQLHRSTGAIEGFSDQLEASARRAGAVENMAGSLEREMRRLAHNVDEQVAKLAANTGSGSELSDGVARLTRKLRQSVAQLDRALVRLNDVLDQTEAG